ncbi:glycine--tRNA ligase subunit beta [Helicobacter saguini]|uniref:Glycine--tRNA ligase beta subunit n=1 Tax=Helicobacter saguini TaxID=1548018 RepID=A0A347VSH4_9HELI|nr:glycine--tRNA ligase subunit beta [Helicobacter saguini]MWV62506.1 glycine--tRNA ligase subunit beta [Helicobacter saguini]MWV66821.1 glycine--tRNA ligase subunit beta [Helicobacter saguini]MWV69171.1 glycine--tRNA ligase subunit beta [Helicobacter saguini]MWV71274.1 glycine--tRNA ligase subunit beta [Helicobacter saguini]TLD94211.1 glycine--tRNA ligase subunit beta [Helicobacter saguini]
MKTTTLLIEVFTEELPALPLLKAQDSIKQEWLKILSENNIESNVEFYFTPRRLVLIHSDFPTKSSEKKEQIYGAPVNIAYDSSGMPTRALNSFLEKNNIDKDALQTTFKDGKEVLFCEKITPGIESNSLLSTMVESWLKSLNFGKSMRWGDVVDGFIRPIRNICILLGDEFIKCDIFALDSNNEIFSHRQATNKSKKIKNLQEYTDFLNENGVILNQEKRREIILNQIQNIESKNNVNVEIDSDLLNEIVAITEFPTALMGSFSDKFLKVPQEMIITSMKENQRYFAVYKDDKLFNAFIVVSNAFVDDFSLIIKGNEKVLKARLHDAEFFYNNDLSAKMDFGNLDSILFMQGAGSLSEKIVRERELATQLVNLLKDSINITDCQVGEIMQALSIAKNDLLSQSVGEFPELQGIMGSYFAKDAGFNFEICRAIREQYLPNGLDSSLPTKKVSAIVNLAIKLDNLFTLFALSKIPTGSKDPFSLRRQAAGLLKICHQFDFDISISDICALSSAKHKSANLFAALLTFITERLYGIFAHINPSIVRSVLVRGFGIKSSFDKILALACYLDSVDIKEVISTFKRVSNILQEDISALDSIAVDISLFEAVESELYKALQDYKAKNIESLKLDSEGYLAKLQNLFALKPFLDKVFDNVLINTDDSRLKQNRIALISLVFKEFLTFGDMREISI